MKFDRCRALFGDDFKKIESAKVLLLGVGGVGSFTLDGLYRSGVWDITIVDFDTYDITNQNRQIGSEAIGVLKVQRLKELYPKITPINAKITKEWVDEFDFESFDIVIDAIDDMSAKAPLAKKVSSKLISSCGSAKKTNPTKIESSSIWKTYSDPFAKKFRYELKKDGFDGDFEVIFSSETPADKNQGSFVGVTGSFGLALCSLAISKIISKT